MLIRTIELENIKCFSGSATIDFCHGKKDDQPHKWVVLYGDNGLGKSTLLKSLGLALTGHPALNQLLPSAEGWVRGNNRYATIRVVAQKGPNDTSVGFPRTRPIILSWILVGRRSTTIHKMAQPAHTVFLSEGESKHQRDDARLLKSQIASDERQRGWMICGYGPHRRLTGAASDIAELISPDGRAARLVTLFHEKAALTSAERWLRDLHHQASIDEGRAKTRLDLIRKIINRGLLHEGVELNEIAPDGVFFKTPFSSKVPIGDLSDGYRTTLALTLDMLRHISYCFDLETVTLADKEQVIVTAEGVVLIDEIDSHLHPSWQRTIGPWLHTRFPNIQFIVATHSPLIPTKVSDNDGLVVRLTRRTQGSGEVVDPKVDLGQFGLTADQNLTGPNFGLKSTRDVYVERLLEEIGALRRRTKKKSVNGEDRAKLRQLELEFEKMAPAAATFAGAKQWQKESVEVARVLDDLRSTDRK